MLLIIILVLLFLFGGLITQFYSCIYGKKGKKLKCVIRVEKSDMAGFKNIFSSKNANKINSPDKIKLTSRVRGNQKSFFFGLTNISGLRK